MSKVPVPPYWLPENLRKTVGGQPVGHTPLYCESFGGSDYCWHCGRDMCTATGKPNVCTALEEIRLRLIPDKEIAAFGCDLEARGADSHCEKWCHKAKCVYSLAETATGGSDGR